MRTMFQKRIRDCDGNVNEYIDVIQDFKQCNIILQWVFDLLVQPFSLHIRSSDLALIPTPSPMQIEKDLVRESFIINGISVDGSSG